MSKTVIFLSVPENFISALGQKLETGWIEWVWLRTTHPIMYSVGVSMSYGITESVSEWQQSYTNERPERYFIDRPLRKTRICGRAVCNDV